MIAGISAFVCGALYEFLAVFWVAFSERGQAWRAALTSSAIAAAMVIGLGETIHDPHVAPFFVIGYGAGTFAGVRWRCYSGFMTTTSGGSMRVSNVRKSCGPPTSKLGSLHTV